LAWVSQIACTAAIAVSDPPYVASWFPRTMNTPSNRVAQCCRNRQYSSEFGSPMSPARIRYGAATRAIQSETRKQPRCRSIGHGRHHAFPMYLTRCHPRLGRVNLACRLLTVCTAISNAATADVLWRHWSLCTRRCLSSVVMYAARPSRTIRVRTVRVEPDAIGAETQ
jgi:hypothetical protein